MKSPVIYFQTKEISITNPGNAPMHIDGEPRESLQQLHIKILPRFFNLIHASAQ
jgi:diacylglycerol kinase family enzyme